MEERVPWLTWLIASTCVTLTLFVTGPSPSEQTLAQFAFKWSDLSTGQAWRLVSSIFVHGNLIHLGFNMLFLLVFGSAFEQAWGSGRFAAVFLGAGVIGSFLHGLFNPGVMVVGASGTLYGLMGVVLLLNPFAPLPILVGQYPAVLGASTYLALLPWLTFGPFSFMAHLAHLGGLFAGALMALFLNFGSAIRFLPGVAIVLLAGPFLVASLKAVSWTSFAGIAGPLWGPVAWLVLGLVAIHQAYKEHMNFECSTCTQAFHAFASWSKERIVLCPHCQAEWVVPAVRDA